jgi:Tol biopolymer transport system component
MINKFLQVPAFILMVIPLSGQDMFTVRQLTFDPAQQGFNEGAVWSPYGKKIAFTSTRSGNFDIWIMDVNIKTIRRDLQKLARP